MPTTLKQRWPQASRPPSLRVGTCLGDHSHKAVKAAFLVQIDNLGAVNSLLPVWIEPIGQGSCLTCLFRTKRLSLHRVL